MTEKKRLSIAARMVGAFLTVAVVPVVIAAVVGVMGFNSAMNAEASNVIDVHMGSAQAVMTQRLTSLVAGLQTYVGGTRAAGVKGLSSADLRDLASNLGVTYVYAVDSSGHVLLSSAGSVAGDRSVDPVVRTALSGSTSPRG